MSYIRFLLYVTVFLSFFTTNGEKLTSINAVYNKAIEAFAEGHWDECVRQFEGVLHLYKLHKSVSINCHHKCNTQIGSTVVKENIEDLQIFETLVNRRNCLLHCLQIGYDDLNLQYEVNNKIIKDLQSRQPYRYLQECYYEVNAIPKAASAAYTYLIKDPFDTHIVESLKHYIAYPQIDTNEINDLESADYTILYKLGIKAYSQGNWGETIAAMEEVLGDYLSTENNCRAECEHLEEQTWSSEFIVTITDYIRSLLQCKQKCQNELKYLEFDSGTSFLAHVLNHLQIAYYQTDRIKDSVKAVASYLMIFPRDEDMIENKKIYLGLTDKDNFIELPDIYYYYKRDQYEKMILNNLPESHVDTDIYM